MLERKVLDFITTAIENDDIDYVTYVRKKLTDFYFTLFSIVLILPISFSLYRMVDIGWQSIFAVHIMIAIIFFSASIFRNHISSRNKAILLIFLFYIAGLAGLLQFGLLSMGLMFFTISSILSFVLLQLKYFQVIAALTTMTILLIGIFYPDGIIQSNIDVIQYAQSVKVWIVVAIAYSLLLISILSGVGIILYSLYGILNKIKSQKKDLLHLNTKLQQISITDNLTQSLNRMGINEAINNELKRLERYNHSFGIILLDVDDFKEVNDTYGHSIGDVVLISIVQLLKKYTRDTDYIGRWGGEEFLIVCPEIKKDDINKLAESVRKHIEQCHFEDVGKVTCSFGTSIINKEDNIDSLLKRADNVLYKAKKDGKNRVCSG